jgi:hypothetical protein
MTRLVTLALLKRTLLALAMLVAGMPPVTVLAGGSPPASVMFTPTTVAVGGTITVSGSYFKCNATVTVVVIDSNGKQIVLGTTKTGAYSPCSFSMQFVLPKTVVAGQYHVGASDTYGHTAVSSGLLTVTAAASPAVTGVASCNNGDGVTLLPGATVQLFSGTALIATTQASSNAQNPTYSFTGIQPNATYQVRYIQANSDGPAISCGTVVTTNADGSGTAPATTACPNEAWDIAIPLISGQTTSVNSDTICKPDQSIWRKIQVAPGQQITVTVLGATGKTRVALFRDLRADFQQLLTNPNGVTAQQLDASMSGQASAPWDASPWDASPWDASPWDASPWDASPWDASPWDASPWDASPWDASALCTDVNLPTTESDTCAGAYSTVQMRDLVAFSSSGQITRNTWDNMGDYYIRVFNADATFDPKQVLTIQAAVVGTCGVPPQPAGGSALQSFASTHILSSGKTDLPDNATTLIITNTLRLRGPDGLPLSQNSDPTLKPRFDSAVTTFSGLTMKNGQKVNGVLVDLKDDPGLQKDFAQWDQPPFSSCPAAANIVSGAIHDLINAYRLQSPATFKYATILGGHTVIPYRLTPDHAELEIEKRYNPGLLDLSKSAGSLASGYVMNDSYYLSFNPITRLESEIGLPDEGLAIGRLVEFPDDIINNLNAFNSNLGAMKPSAALATGYTFVSDLAQDEVNLFKKGGVTDTDSLISDTWTAPDLKGKLFDPARDGVTGPNFDILALNWHAQSNEAVAADFSTTHPSVVKSSDIANFTADNRFSNVLVLSIGCHLAYPLINADVIPNPTNPPQFVTDARAFTETFQNKGAMVLGNTGYGYGDTDFEGYTEHLLSLVTQRLETGTAGDGGVPVGMALTNAKRDYIAGSAALTGVDRKSVEELTFYGPPMWSVDFPVRSPMPGSNTLPITPVSADADAGLSAAKVIPQYTLAQKTTSGDPGTTYFEADGGKQQMPFRADLPYKTYDASQPGSGAARGVALTTADYQDATNTTSTVSLPATELPGSRPGWVTHGFWPFQTYGLNQLAGQALFVTPIQWLSSNATGTLGTTRSYPNAGNTSLRVYYSTATGGQLLAGPATISDVSVSTTGPNKSLVHVDVTVGGSNIGGLFDVLVSYTGTVPTSPFYGHWQTCSLFSSTRTDTDTTSHACSTTIGVLSIATRPGSFLTHFSGDIDATTAPNASDLHLLVQVVTNSGLVTTRDNNGQYFFPDSATITTPKAKTSLSLVDPISNPVTYGRTATFSANLTADRTTCSVANRSVTFHLGSQARTVTTNGAGLATASFTVFTIPTTIQGVTPASYPLNVTFSETPDCLASFATDASQVSVQKKDTKLAFVNSNAFLAKLTDADNVALRDEFLFFTVTGSGITVTRSAQTDANGIAQLRDVQVPAGTYTVTVSFPGTIPTTGGVTIKLTDERYNPAPSITLTGVAADVTAPSCVVTTIGTNASGQKFVQITVQDTGSGLAAVNPTEQVNLLPLQIQSYTAGVTTAVVVTATKKDQTLSSQIALEVDDVAGNVTNCDPILAAVGNDGPGGLPRSETFRHVASGESHVMITNGTPGLTRLALVVNGHRYELRDLNDGETQTLDVSSAMHKGANNRITVIAQGKAQGSAVILVADSP